jgi:hypothetical protein
MRFTFIMLALSMTVAAAQQQTNSAQQTRTAQTGDYSFDVPASRPWTDTGLDLGRGQSIHVYGSVISCSGPTPREKDHLPLPSAPGGILLMKLNLDSRPIPATPDAEVPVIAPSHLYLGVNGSGCGGGRIPAKVHVQDAPANQSK